MCIIESCSNELWHIAFRKEMAKGNKNGIYIQFNAEVWLKLEFEETYFEGAGAPEAVLSTLLRSA